MKHIFTVLSLVVAHAAAAAPEVGAILDPGQWTLSGKGGSVAKYSMRTSAGQPVLVGDLPVLYLQGTTETKAGSELSFLARLDNTTAPIALTISGEPAGGEALVLSLNSKPGSDAITATLKLASKGPRDFLARRIFTSRWIAKTSLGLPEDMRIQVEHQIASLTPLNQLWLPIRWQVREDGARIYIADRLLWDGPVAGPVKFRLELPKVAEVATLRTVPIAGAKPGFEPITLDGYVNATTLDGAKLSHTAGSATEVNGVPFVFAKPDARGNDHVDLGPSWFPTGFLSGRASPRDGPVGGRWDGAWAVNPGRIQFTLPKGRYSAIHLLAAADGEPDSVPVVTAQFYMPERGRPIQSKATQVQRFNAAAQKGTSVPATLANGQKGNLFLVTIPIEPGELASLDEVFELELTKNVQLYRAYPDPMFYSFHAAGLPSAVHVYALTLQRPAVAVELQAANGLHIWTAPEKPAYIATLRAGTPMKVTVEATTTSYDGAEKTAQTKTVEVKGETPVRFEFDLKKFGYHQLAVKVTGAGGVIQTEKRGLARLHPDTRERGDWARGKGAVFGFWNWRGGHGTPAEPLPTRIMGLAGAEADHGAYYDSDRFPPESRAVAREFKMRAYKGFGSGDHYVTLAFASDLDKFGLEVAKTNFLAKLAERRIKPDDLNLPIFISFYAEPSIGLHTPGIPLSYDGLSETNDYVFTPDEEKRFQFFLKGFVEGAKVVKEAYPEVKCLLPHGDPGFAPPFLRRSAEARQLFEGVTVDIPGFERLPEMQIHQVAMHRLWYCREEYRKAGHENPWLPMYEGPCLPSRPGSLTPDEHAALNVRNSLIMLGYGVDIQVGGWSAFDAGSYWGEQHYGGGICDAVPLATPKPSYGALATMTRQLNRRNFDKWVPTGSLSTYAVQFKHYKDASLTHAVWTIRGKRPVTVSVPANAKVAVYDSMDNRTDLPVKDGAVTFTVAQAPCFVVGLPDAPKITLGEPDHSDAAPTPGAIELSKLGDGTWSVSTERDLAYEDSFKAFIRRYPAKMTARPVEDKGLAIHLETPERELKAMPFYTTLVPAKPILIPGKASHLGLWVNASSDWGRVIYSVRDAKGERWISIGVSGAWNCDDLHSWSYFNFDGRRYLRFELPACAPYDLFREAGTSWWGAYSKGDKVPDLPLTLEKIIVERRTHALYVNDPQPASPNDVVLGGLFAEYASPDDKTDRAVQLAQLRMPVPPGVPALPNPIQRFTTAGQGEPTAITGITVPLQDSDGTRCVVNFQTTPAASAYEVWASPYEDGRGAVQVASKLKDSGARARGFIPDTDFYLFVVYTDAKGKPSKPSAPYKINLKDTFAQK